MVEGVDLKYLSEGPGHFPGTPLPGQAGNAAVAGHRTTYKAPFNRIDELQPGDKIFITTLQGHFTYKVMAQAPDQPGGPALGHRIVKPNAVEILGRQGRQPAHAHGVQPEVLRHPAHRGRGHAGGQPGGRHSRPPTSSNVEPGRPGRA